MPFSKKDKNLLRDLAKRVADIATIASILYAL